MDSATAVTQVLQLGFAVVVSWYLLTKAIPRSEDRADRRDAAFLAANEKRDASTAALLEKQHVYHAAEIGRLLSHHERQTDRVIDAVNGLDCAPTSRDRERNSNGGSNR